MVDCGRLWHSFQNHHSGLLSTFALLLRSEDYQRVPAVSPLTGPMEFCGKRWTAAPTATGTLRTDIDPRTAGSWSSVTAHSRNGRWSAPQAVLIRTAGWKSPRGRLGQAGPCGRMGELSTRFPRRVHCASQLLHGTGLSGRCRTRSSLSRTPTGTCMASSEAASAPACTIVSGCGVIFEMTPNQDGTWTYHVLHRFGSYPTRDGQMVQSDGDPG